MTDYELHETSGSPIKAWTRDVPVEAKAMQQLRNVAHLPFIHRWVAAMPDVHWGIGATVGSVIPTKGAIIPAAVGVDIGCGMVAARTTLEAKDLPDSLKNVRKQIERRVPVGRGVHRDVPNAASAVWRKLERRFDEVRDQSARIAETKPGRQLGTLGGGNHFIEVCLDEEDRVWVMLHSGSRGVGNRIGQHFIAQAKKEMEDELGSLPDKDLAYFREGSQRFDDYVLAVEWAQDYARANRDVMLQSVLEALASDRALPPFRVEGTAVNCHHNYVTRETHYGESVFVTRKGAVRAGAGELGIIPGSMGARSFIVRGKGNDESFHSCSHGAGRLMSRGAARRAFSVADHEAATRGVECRKDAGVIDEIPGAYKDIDQVMANQDDLVEVVHTLKQVVCVKG